ncbi:hypothetical protein E2C01_089959 [Portunus trituberculatus]|uniref:Uncharacterized protein n=1 Tax=Portunus trituberculatus TaxID=210409 RepID=A0A5B7JJM8_PORTR|nr:hypothetical protein [Portunus trituberculatus]
MSIESKDEEEPQKEDATSFYTPCSTPTGSSMSQSQLEYPPGHHTASCRRTSDTSQYHSAAKSSDANVPALPTLSTLYSIAATKDFIICTHYFLFYFFIY